PMKVFYTILTGKTLGAHDAFSRKLEAIGQIEVSSPDHCDYYLAFCPIVSRVGTDISEAMEKIPGDKQVILVVMHHTINPDSYIGDSSRHVSRPDVILTVDCVFYEGRFHNCSRNKNAFNEVERLVGPPSPSVPGPRTPWNYILNCWKNNRPQCVMAFCITVGVIIYWRKSLRIFISRHIKTDWGPISVDKLSHCVNLERSD
ncbi:uncharacterized protein, partial [Centroberyx affinis]|uniref:uncharacterized protein n=1 Tax=Centroberyx affinis TaxID=166261 RepID=UPI003A5C3F52